MQVRGLLADDALRAIDALVAAAPPLTPDRGAADQSRRRKNWPPNGPRRRAHSSDTMTRFFDRRPPPIPELPIYPLLDFSGIR
jgi:hypothetical protein